METTGAPRVLILDDNRVGREGIASLLQGRRDISVVATTADRELALAMAEKHSIDVVLAGASVMEKDGAVLARELMRRSGGGAVKVVAIGLVERSWEISKAVEAGVAGYLTKSASVADLVGMVRAVTQPKDLWVVERQAERPGTNGRSSGNT